MILITVDDKNAVEAGSNLFKLMCRWMFQLDVEGCQEPVSDRSRQNNGFARAKKTVITLYYK